MLRSCVKPNTISNAANVATTSRSFKLDSMIQRIMCGLPGDRLSSFCALRLLRRLRVPVRLLADPVRALLQSQRLRAGVRQGVWPELRDFDQLQRLLQFLSLTSPADSNIAHAASVVLELLRVRLLPAGLGDHQHVLVAALADTGLLAHLVHRRAVRPLHGGPPPLRVARGSNLRLCLHGDARARLFTAVEPNRGLEELPALPLLGVLTQEPDVPVVVLCEEGDLRLRQLAIFVVHIPDHDRTHAADHLGQVGDDGHQATRHGLPIVLDGGPRIDEPRSRLQGEPFVVDAGRAIVEALRVEVPDLLVLRHHRAAGQAETRERDEEAQLQARSNDPAHHGWDPPCRRTPGLEPRALITGSAAPGNSDKWRNPLNPSRRTLSNLWVSIRYRARGAVPEITRSRNSTRQAAALWNQPVWSDS